MNTPLAVVYMTVQYLRGYGVRIPELVCLRFEPETNGRHLFTVPVGDSAVLYGTVRKDPKVLARYRKHGNFAPNPFGMLTSISDYETFGNTRHILRADDVRELRVV